jgi:single-stranded-DNA-specific exonuclease
MLERMAPFGTGNERPRFATSAVDLVGPPRVVGKSGGHIQLSVRQNGDLRRAIAFHKADQAQAMADAGRVRLAFEPIINEWNGNRRVELKVIDWKPAEPQ